MLISHYIIHALFPVLGSNNGLMNPENIASASGRECTSKLWCDWWLTFFLY